MKQPSSQSQDNSADSKATVTVKPMRFREAREVHRVFVKALLQHFEHFDDSYKQAVLAQNTLASLARAALTPSRVILVAKDQTAIIGYMIASVPRDKNGQLYWLFVDSAYRGQNIGLMLLSRGLKVMKTKGAHTATLVTHDHAKYYARQGFKLIEKVPDGKYIKYVLTYDLNR